MGYAIPIEVYNRLEEKLGKETAAVVVEALQISIKEAIKEGRSELKAEVSEELKKELATKYDVELVKKDVDLLRKDMDLLREEMLKEIALLREEMYKEIALVRKDMKITTIIIIAVIVLLNQNSLEFLARLLGLLK
ncbi:MAG: hypothetical protein ACK415_05715 [Thermodesulfovibrionales bacterium]